MVAPIYPKLTRITAIDHQASQLREYQESKLAEYGWYACVIPFGANTPTGYEAHTHGLAEKSNHPDFQIVFPMQPELAHALLALLVRQVQSGTRFKAGDVDGRTLKTGHRLTFAEAVEGDRTVLRVILPDPDGKLFRDEISHPYVRQYEGLVS